MSVALVAASIFLQLFPFARIAQAEVETNRQTAIDDVRGLLGISVFVHHTVITWFFLHGAGWALPRPASSPNWGKPASRCSS